MFIQVTNASTDGQLETIRDEVLGAGFSQAIVSLGEEITVINCIGAVAHERKLTLRDYFLNLPGVIGVEIAKTPYRLTSRESHPGNFSVQLNGISIGGNEPIVVMAGPCAVESLEQVKKTADAVKASGAKALRGGAFKPRKSRFAYQGLGEEGLKILAQIGQETCLPIVTEVISPDMVGLVAEYADILQIGTANMNNYELLKAVGQCDRPVILKRGMAAQVDELLLAAEYIVAEGNSRVVLCLRGIRTFETGHTRFTADIGTIPVLKKLTHYPVIFDPSHPAGDRELVTDYSLAAIAAGADGLLIEVHYDPPSAKCDGPQSLYPEQFASLMEKVAALAQIMGRSV